MFNALCKMGSVFVTCLVAVLISGPTWSADENIDRTVSNFQELVRSSVGSQKDLLMPICDLAENTNRALRPGFVSWSLGFACNRSDGQKLHSAKIAVKIETYSHQHQSLSLRNADDFMNSQVDDKNPADQKLSDWFETSDYVAQIKQRRIDANLDGLVETHEVSVSAETLRGVEGLWPDGDFRPDTDPVALRVSVKVKFSSDDMNELSVTADNFARDVTDSTLAGLLSKPPIGEKDNASDDLALGDDAPVDAENPDSGDPDNVNVAVEKPSPDEDSEVSEDESKALQTELVIWNDVKESDSVEELQYYLQLYPEGMFAPIANIRIGQLKKQQEEEELAALVGTEQSELGIGMTRSDRRDLQMRLRELGFDPKGIDGRFGRNSRNAIRGWQTQNSYEASGFLTGLQFELIKTQSEPLMAAAYRKLEEANQASKAKAKRKSSRRVSRKKTTRRSSSSGSNVNRPKPAPPKRQTTTGGLKRTPTPDLTPWGLVMD